VPSGEAALRRDGARRAHAGSNVKRGRRRHGTDGRKKTASRASARRENVAKEGRVPRRLRSGRRGRTGGPYRRV